MEVTIDKATIDNTVNEVTGVNIDESTDQTAEVQSKDNKIKKVIVEKTPVPDSTKREKNGQKPSKVV